MARPRVALTEPATSTSACMSIAVNGEPREVPRDSTVADLLAILEVGKRRVAVAVNGDVVPRSGHASAALAPGDQVEILEAVGGG